MKTLCQYLGILIAGILLFFLSKPFVQAHKQLEAISLQIQWRGDCFGRYCLFSQAEIAVFQRHLKHLAIAWGIGLVILFSLLQKSSSTCPPCAKR